MIIKKSNGFVGIDMILAIAGILIFSALIFTLMYNNALENSKIKKEALAVIYLTEILENIGIASYEEINQASIENRKFLPTDLPGSYNVNIEITTDQLSISEEQKNDNIIKKITASVSYKVGNKDYKLSMQRVKTKE